MFCISTIMHWDTSDYMSTTRGVYKRIVSTNIEPPGPLKQMSRRLHSTKLTPFKDPFANSSHHSCFYCLNSLNDSSKLMTQEEIPELIAYMSSNNYKIDTSITQMLNENTKLSNPDKTLVCFATYQ